MDGRGSPVNGASSAAALSKDTAATLRRQIVHVLMIWRELLAAGFRSPELLEEALTLVRPESATTLRTFSRELVDCLDACTEDAVAPALSSSHSGGDATALGLSGSARSSRAGRGADARGRFRRAIVGGVMPPLPPDSLEVPVDKAVSHQGLVHGETSSLQEVLTDYPRLLRFLAVRFGLLSEDAGNPEMLTAKAAAVDSQALSDALTQAHMVWVQRHPLDYIVAAKKSSSPLRASGAASPPGSPAGRSSFGADAAAISAQQQAAMLPRLLLLNLDLRYKVEEWSPLIQARDGLLVEIAMLLGETEGACPTPLLTEVVRIASSLNERLPSLPIHASPSQLATLLMDYMTRALSDVTMALHEHDSSLVGGSGSAVRSSPRSFLDRLSSKPTPSQAAAAPGAQAADQAAAACTRALKASMGLVMQCQAAHGWGS